MADPADAWDKNHAYRADAGNLLRVLSGAAGHRSSREAEGAGVVFDKLSHPVVGKSGVTNGGFGKAETSLIEFAQCVGFSANPIEHADKLLFVQVWRNSSPSTTFPQTTLYAPG